MQQQLQENNGELEAIKILDSDMKSCRSPLLNCIPCNSRR